MSAPAIPENHVIAEGRTLRAAIEDAARTLNVAPALVQHRIDMAHFRSATGQSAGADTVRIFAWARDAAALAPLVAAEAWLTGLLAAMGRTGTVRGELRGDEVVLYVDAGPEGRHLVGRGGTTLRAIQHLLETSLAGAHANARFRIDIARAAEDGDAQDGGAPREERRDERRGRDRDDRRGGRDRDDRRGGGRDRERGGRRDDDEAELRKLARKLALKVQETGEPEMIRRELNGFERRIVHTEVAEIPGVKTRSIGEGRDRKVEIYAEDAGEE
jgi:predicted RNA-binding protein Jag